MDWLPVRLLAALMVGALLGYGVGHAFVAPLTFMAIGACIGAAIWVLLQTLRASRLMRWLRTASGEPAPAVPGMWAELAYWIERALRSREREFDAERLRLEQLLSGIQASPNGVTLLDADDQIDWCSRVAADHLGLDAERDVRQPITNLLRVPEFVAYLKSGRWADPITFAIPGRSHVLSLLIRGHGDGRKLLLTQDITERQRTDAMRRDFVANVSHEIRTPLTVLSGFLESLDSLPLDGEERRRVLTLMRQQADRMQMLVDDLLTLAQIEGSPWPQADTWVSVQELIQRTIDDARRLSGGRHRIECDVVGGAEIAGVEAELLSAMGNLLTNAVRYTPEGGRIEVVWRLREGGAGEFEVRDTGIGIAREHLPRLTERFYRVDGSRSRETGGTGLGLSIVKHVMQRHGGELVIESEIGKGSCFRLLFASGRVRSPAGRVTA